MQPLKSVAASVREHGKDQQQRQSSELDRRYAKIGMSAVAADVRYQSDAKRDRKTARMTPNRYD